MHENESLASEFLYFLGASQPGLPGRGAVPRGGFAAFEMVMRCARPGLSWVYRAGSDADSAGACVNVIN